MTKTRTLAAALFLASSTIAGAARADITRTEVLDRAKAYVFYPWRASAANQSASCVADYQSAFVPGDYMGVAYDWGGFDSLFQFDQKISAGYGAGSPAFGDVYSCTTGVDCSGFVSRTWHTNSKYGTATIHQVSSEIAVGDLLPGDAFNDAGNHIALYSHMLGNGEPFMYEAVGFNVHLNATGGWSYVDGFLTRRYNSITGTSVADPQGTLNNPIVVSSFPFVDSRDTRTSPSDLLDGCGAASDKNESGHEYIYQVEITEPGQLTVAVSDDVGVDIDVHLASSWNTGDCVARHDSSFTYSVDCGTYYVIADTFGSETNAGPYDLTISLSPSGTSCGNGPEGYAPKGNLGEACAFPGNPQLPFCNPTLGSDVCLYTDADSFCSKACASAADCADMPGGGCCEDIGEGEYFCLLGDFCPAIAEPDAGPSADPDAGPSGSPDGGPGDPSDPSGGSDDDSSGCRIGARGKAPWLPLLALALIAFRRRRN